MKLLKSTNNLYKKKRTMLLFQIDSEVGNLTKRVNFIKLKLISIDFRIRILIANTLLFNIKADKYYKSHLLLILLVNLGKGSFNVISQLSFKSDILPKRTNVAKTLAPLKAF